MIPKGHQVTWAEFKRAFKEYHIPKGLMDRKIKELLTLKQVTDMVYVSYGPPWAHYLGGYQDRLLGGPLGVPGLCHTAPDGVRRKDYGGEVLG
jgi:hypothetical protein